MNTTEEIFYKIGKFAFLPVLAGMLFLSGIPIEALHVLPGCAFLRITGLYCPGCGGTRALYYLAQGQLAASLRCHPFVLYTAAVYCIFMAACYYRRHFGRKEYASIKIEYAVYFGIAVILIQWFLKNAGILSFP